MNETTRVPQTIGEFDIYLNTTDDYLQGSRDGTLISELLGLTPSQSAEWSSRRIYWRDDLHKKWSNPLTKTQAVNLQVRNFMQDFRDFSRPLLNKMAASDNATEEDEVALNFKISRKDPTHPTTPIEDIVVLSLQAIGGGDIRISGRTSHDASRPSVPDDAKGLELRYLIGKEAPLSVDECEEHLISTKSGFVLNVGAKNHNKNIYCFARWVDTSDPSRAGSWTKMVTSGIL